MVNFIKHRYLKSLWLLTFLLIIEINHKTFAQAPIVTLPTVTTVTPTGATLGGSVTGTLTHRGTRWSTTSPVGTSNELEEVSVTTGAFTQARTSLPVASRIFFVAYARNNLDVGTTTEITFFTEPIQLTGGDFSVTATSEATILLTFPAADSWEGTGATGGYVIFRNAGSAPSLGALADGAAPPADGVGDKIATITDGTATSFNNTTGLNAETEYHYTIVPFVWDGSTASTYNYNLTTPQTNNAFTFSTNPTNHPSNGTFAVTAVSSSQINLAFDAPSGNTDGYIILRRNDAADPTTAGIVDGVNPATLAGLLPVGTTLVGTSTGSSFNDTGLSPATRYRYLIIPYNANAISEPGTFNYKTDGTPVTPKNDWTFASEPSSHATGSLTATPVSSSQINLSFNSITTSGITNATGYVLLIKNSAIVVGDLASLDDGATPNSFGLFKAIINSTSASTYNDATGLSPNTTYHYALIPFNRISDDETYNYLTTTGFVTGSATTLAIGATFVEIPSGTAPVISGLVLSAGTATQVITGFSVTSEGTQEINTINFNYSPSNPGQLTNEYLYRSTTVGTLGALLLTDATPDGNFDLSAVGAANRTITSTPVYYYLVVDVDNTVTNATGSVSIAPTQANITVNTGIVNNFAINKTFTFNTSQNSDIILNGGTTASINYINHRQPDVTDAKPSLATFRIRDGSGSSDGDNKGTILTALTIGLTNHNMVRRIALYDGISEVGGTDQEVTGPTVSFPSISLTANDGSTKDFTIRATFQNVVTDKTQIHVNIVSATASTTGSGFATGNAGGASSSTAAPTNIIEVTASALVLSGNPSNQAINTNFPLTIRAQDAQNNVDIDYAGCVDLTRSPATGTLSVQPGENLNPTLVNGEYNWTTLRLSQSGNYTLTASDDDPCLDEFSNPSVSIAITSSNSTITPGTTTPSPFCYGNSFFNLSNIVIAETDVGGISGSPGSYSFSIALPSGFVFDQTVTSGVSVSGAGDITIPAPPHYSYPAANIVEFSFNLTGTSVLNTLTLSGLKVRHPHPGTASPPPTGTLNITRLGGTAIIAGVAANAVLGSVAASQQNPAVNFTVAALTGNPFVDPNTTTFNVSSVPVNLVPSSALAESVFTGSGVSFSSPNYRFNPSSLAAGSYPITLSHTAANGCQSYNAKTFEVIISGIVGLNTTFYCNNDAPSPLLSVNQAYIDQIMGGPGWQLSHFVYYKTAAGTFNWVPFPVTSPNQFNPGQPEFAAEYNYWGGQIPIGFAVCNGTVTYPCGTSNYIVTYQWVTVRTAPTVSFTMPNIFCVDDAPITLIGNPPNSDNILEDRFNEDSPNAPISVSPTNPRVWSFSPSTMGVGTANISYTYRDPSTGCSATSAPVAVTVNPRPTAVPVSDITSGTSQTICQGGTYSNFVAATIPGTSYTWYAGSALTDVVGSTNVFSPPVDITIAQNNTFYVTRTILGCESNKQPVTPPPALSVSVNVIATPGPPAPNRNLSYCVADPIPPAALQITTATGTVRWYRTGNPVAVFTGTNPTAVDLGINNMVAGLYVFELTQTEPTGCEGPIPGSRPIFTIEIKPLPSLTLTADVANLNNICTSRGIFTVTAFDQGSQTTGGAWSGAGLAGALSPTPFGEVIINPVNLNPNNYALQYDYTSSISGCSNNTSINFKVPPRLNVTFNPLDSCDKAFVRLNNLSDVNYGALPPIPATTITETSWLFQDGTSLAFGNGAIPSGTNGGRTQGTYFNPEHKFSSTGGFGVQVTMHTSDGCEYTGSKQLNIKPKPVINFTWENPCRIDGNSPTDTTRTVFHAVETSTPAIALTSFTWNFKVENVLDYFSASTGADPIVKYNKDGIDDVRLIAISVDGCRDTLQKAIYVVPNAAKLNTSTSYVQSFSADGDRWLAGGQNPSWQHGTPNGTIINTPGEKAWITNPTGPSNSNEKSWVLSRCFDFTATTRPIIALDIWSDTPAGIDGAVLQVNTSGDIELDANWTVVGAVGEGVNWYDQGGIASKPGNQPAGDVGWTGSSLDGRYTTWKNARFKLDNLIGLKNVTFRIAYASTLSAREGFAFDNIFIGERNRNVIVENFTNTSAAANANVHNDAFRNFEKNSPDIVKLQYHTAFPGTDAVNSLNTLMHNARATFYGIASVPTFRVDGDFRQGPAASWFTPLYNDRILEPSQLEIESPIVKEGAVVKINTVIRNTSTATFPAGSHIFTVVAEKSIINPSYLGSPNDTLQFVAKQILPSPSGLIINQDIPAGGTFTVPEIIWDYQNLIRDTQGAIVIFIQSVEGGNKRVHQAKVFLSPPIPDMITSIEDPTFAASIQVYPNPANREVNIVLPQAARTAIPIVMVDAQGRQIYTGQFATGEQQKTIITTEMASGLYILHVQAPEGIARKKVMVVHEK